MNLFSSFYVGILLAVTVAPALEQRLPLQPPPAPQTERRMTLLVNDRRAANAVIQVNGRS